MPKDLPALGVGEVENLKLTAALERAVKIPEGRLALGAHLGDAGALV
jgi:hypothetical protein